MVLEEVKKVVLCVSFFPTKHHAFQRGGVYSQHFKRNHESIALPVALIGLCNVDRPNND